jgi:hypothetical protein
MIKDGKGRKWYLRFKQYRQGWYWEARHENYGQSSGSEFFKTKALAEADACRKIRSHDAVASSGEYLHRLCRRGTVCRLTAADWNAIERAG